ncbi:MAG: hypothetical protein A2941_01035 [Candidatus Yanofskybacteria bacterium RIFCSPLOWO2_01_FULL_49_17]|uniref:Band 7 domain-containing protein n=1 Tax=Candidatus Yanofskybacteria bacterium RIFCSPLOWO2_01_FULL_49_17 TaxID=1802700 RepID=A0A1F8GR11_9BACT|nr:MAG: hypothetical protein A2941_01035 [Candidatus Yanofskybacteria bacterium RIFCSPLOWO2_01_FULL_49_17]
MEVRMIAGLIITLLAAVATLIVELVALALSYPVPAWFLVWVVLSGLVVFTRFRTVPQDERWAMTIFGKYSRTLYPGLNLTVRWLEKIATTRQAGKETVSIGPSGRTTKMLEEVGLMEKYKKTPKGVRSTRIYVRNFEITGTITADGVTIPVIQAQISNRLMTENENRKADPVSRLGPVFKNTFVLGASMREALMGLVDGVVRSVLGKHQIAYILEHPDEIKREIEDGLRIEMDLWGEHLIRLYMTEIIPTKDIQESLQKPFKEEMNAKAAKHEGEALAARAIGERDARIHQAEGEATSTRLVADAERDKRIAEAEGQKQAAIKESEGKTQVLKNLAQAFGFKEDGNFDQNLHTVQSAADFMTIEERLDAAKALGSGSGTVLISSPLIKEVREIIGSFRGGAESMDTNPS